MGMNTEDIFLRLENFKATHRDDYDSEEEMVQAFIEQYNTSLEEGESAFMSDDRIEAMEWYQDAAMTDDPDQALIKLKKALELDPTNLDIKLAIYLEEEEDDQTYISLLEADLEAYYRNHRRELAESGYFDIDNRPYFRCLAHVAGYYKMELRYDKAINYFKKLLKLDDRDPLGVRYGLMGVYVSTFDFRKARAHYKKYDRDHQDIQLMAMMIVSLWLEGDEAFAAKLIKKVVELSPASRLFFEEEFYDIDCVFDYTLEESYGLNSPEAFAVGLMEVSTLLQQSQLMYRFIKDTVEQADPQEKKSAKSGQTSKKASAEDDQAVSATKPDASDQKAKSKAKKSKDKPTPAEADSEVFQGIAPQYVHLLQEAGYQDMEDFKELSQEDILAIDGVGPSTLEKLKANGVQFK